MDELLQGGVNTDDNIWGDDPLPIYALTVDKPVSAQSFSISSQLFCPWHQNC